MIQEPTIWRRRLATGTSLLLIAGLAAASGCTDAQCHVDTTESGGPVLSCPGEDPVPISGDATTMHLLCADPGTWLTNVNCRADIESRLPGVGGVDADAVWVGRTMVVVAQVPDPNGASQTMGLWIDLNHDQRFDMSEMIPLDAFAEDGDVTLAVVDGKLLIASSRHVWYDRSDEIGMYGQLLDLAPSELVDAGQAVPGRVWLATPNGFYYWDNNTLHGWLDGNGDGMLEASEDVPMGSDELLAVDADGGLEVTDGTDLFTWHDANGDGVRDPGEFETTPGFSCGGYAVDSEAGTGVVPGLDGFACVREDGVEIWKHGQLIAFSSTGLRPGDAGLPGWNTPWVRLGSTKGILGSGTYAAYGRSYLLSGDFFLREASTIHFAFDGDKENNHEIVVDSTRRWVGGASADVAWLSYVDTSTTMEQAFDLVVDVPVPISETRYLGEDCQEPVAGSHPIAVCAGTLQCVDGTCTP